MGFSQLAMQATNMIPVMARWEEGLDAPSSSSNWSVSTFLNNSIDTLQTWGGYLVLLIGVILIIYAIVKIALGLSSYGKKPTNWAVSIIMLVLGGAMLFGGWTMISGIAAGGKQTIEDIGSGGLMLLGRFLQ